jgi:hypothetical protein
MIKHRNIRIASAPGLAAIGLAAGLALAPLPAAALTITTVTTGDAAAQLIPPLLAPGSGITVVPGTETYQGSLAAGQSGTYTGFTLVPSSGSGPTLSLPNGIVLTSGTANLPMTNTVNQFNPVFPATGSNALLSTLAGNTTNDANALGFSFTVASGNSVQAQFVFGTDEFPTQSVTDIFGFFIDGVNYAKFPGGELISNTSGNPTNFIPNPVATSPYGIEYNGLTQVFTVTGLLDPTLLTHTIVIAVADTSDSIYDSGVFIGGLTTSTVTDGGGIGTTDVPEPATLSVLGLGLLGLGIARRRRQRAR